MSGMKITRAVVPSLFTILNIFCGFRSVVYAAEGDFSLAALFIMLAATFDVLDGVMARITRSSSDFGVELDSLSDVVSFGVAPSFLVYRAGLQSFGGPGMLISALPMVFGAIRLARFNAQLVGYDKEFFKGLPIPASAILLAGYVSAYRTGSAGFGDLEAVLLMAVIVLLSLLMVSAIRYDTFPQFTRRGIKQHPLRFAVGIAGLTWIVVSHGTAIFPFFVFYTATGPLRYFARFIGQLLHPPSKVESEKEAEISSLDV